MLEIGEWYEKAKKRKMVKAGKGTEKEKVGVRNSRFPGGIAR